MSAVPAFAEETLEPDQTDAIILFFPVNKETGVQNGRVHVWGGHSVVPPTGAHRNDDTSFASYMALEFPVAKYGQVGFGYANFGHHKNHHADAFLVDGNINIVSIGGGLIRVFVGAGGQLTYDTTSKNGEPSSVDHVPGLNAQAAVSLRIFRNWALEMGYLQTWNEHGASPSIVGIGLAVDLEDDSGPGGNHLNLPDYTLSVAPGLEIENGPPNDRSVGVKVAFNGPIHGPIGYAVFILASDQNVSVAQQLRLSKRFGHVEIGGAAGPIEGNQGVGAVVTIDAKYWLEMWGHPTAIGFTVNRDWFKDQDHDFATVFEITTGIVEFKKLYQALSEAVK